MGQISFCFFPQDHSLIRKTCLKIFKQRVKQYIPPWEPDKVMILKKTEEI